MSFPLPGDGVIVGTVGQVLPIGVLYLAPLLATPTPAPGVPLGGTDPSAPWVRMGLMKDEQLSLEEKDPDVVEYRRGFRQRYFGEVIRKSGERTLTCTIVEVEPLVIARISKDPVVTLGGSPATGYEMDMIPSELLNLSMLYNYYDDLSGREFAFYAPHVIARYKFGKDAEFMTIDLTIRMVPFINGAGQYADMKYYAFEVPGTSSF